MVDTEFQSVLWQLTKMHNKTKTYTREKKKPKIYDITKVNCKFMLSKIYNKAKEMLAPTKLNDRTIMYARANKKIDRTKKICILVST